MCERFKIVPEVEKWNQMIEDTGLERQLPFMGREDEFIKIKAFFDRKSRGEYNYSALVKNVQVKRNGVYYDISHLWITSSDDKLWDALKHNQLIFIEGKVKEYYDSSNNHKYSLEECRLIGHDEFF